jgi:RimJ/RimL family protein N-acetyltransferase
MMKLADLSIRKIGIADRHLINTFIGKQWGSPYGVSRGKRYLVSELPGFICRQNEQIIGLITYHIHNNDCEIVTLDSTIPNRGLGSRLILKVIDQARAQKCRRVWLITTNDNIRAIRFYQKFGFEWVAFHQNAISESRKLKPEIPQYGNDDIPIKHEIEFEYILKD